MHKIEIRGCITLHSSAKEVNPTDKSDVDGSLSGHDICLADDTGCTRDASPRAFAVAELTDIHISRCSFVASLFRRCSLTYLSYYKE
jgi:hypothetical protein